jgi:hypothetical protein
VAVVVDKQEEEEVHKHLEEVTMVEGMIKVEEKEEVVVEMEEGMVQVWV